MQFEGHTAGAERTVWKTLFAGEKQVMEASEF